MGEFQPVGALSHAPPFYAIRLRLPRTPAVSVIQAAMSLTQYRRALTASGCTKSLHIAGYLHTVSTYAQRPGSRYLSIEFAARLIAMFAMLLAIIIMGRSRPWSDRYLFSSLNGFQRISTWKLSPTLKRVEHLWSVSRLSSRDGRRAKPKREAESATFRTGHYERGSRNPHPPNPLAFWRPYSA